ncbi:DNA repair protein RecO [Luminiphilus syltensis NOR5-1B]|uniref:DNA repair protein RecO n=1 Tax=Luminiphilus syltensis NOR5-1B TaxID=565045 RepID=B8KRH0_9GAMM|nr:DNA repair protein RecO [Luminiphilus syltensis NOR5-1B]
MLHRRSYGDNGLLLEVFTHETGRLSAVAKGVHRRSRGGAKSGLLQPFTPLLITLAGNSDLKQLRQIESAGANLRLDREAMISALYVNELLVRLLPKFDPQPQLFADYGSSLQDMKAGGNEPVLRRFEWRLLEALGYQPNLSCDVLGESLLGHRRYALDPTRGLVGVDDTETDNSGFTGNTLIRVIDALENHSEFDREALACAKYISRRALKVQLGDKPLRSRELARAFLSGSTRVPAARADGLNPR